MNETDLDKVGGFLSRWSKRKLEQDRQPGATNPVPAPPAGADAAEGRQASEAPPRQSSADRAPGEHPQAPSAPLPAVESLTPDSDFTPFMRPNVAAGVKQAALKQLFKDPHFNVMDGLDIYIDDYSIEDPIPDAMMKTLYQARQHLFSDAEKAAADKADALAANEARAEGEAPGDADAAGGEAPAARENADSAGEAQADPAEYAAEGLPGQDAALARKDA